MAGAAEKKQAKYNVETLKQIHIISAVVNLFSLVCLFVFHRPNSKKPYFIFSIPGWFCEFVIEKIGRPKYKKDDVRGFQMLVNAGEDLRQQGLTEYIFDVFYLTEACDVFMCLFGSNMSYLILLLIPIYAVYKLASLWLRFRSKVLVIPHLSRKITVRPNQRASDRRSSKLGKVEFVTQDHE
ncbi:DEBR0S6_04412g1_1 [Brettanomyces bruxellensis]|uniref:DEBR0S6_04412g1_1 n=1 Tax=Dekkera bruxellensis TaxID=5007 RepID=A0A7D9H2N7_DEKBR|nr:DEBR0S6_04412g1_1 [Brettanomyces bruxellensis]